MRALLARTRKMCENEEDVQTLAGACAVVLEVSMKHLTILDPEVGEEELIEVVEAALAKLNNDQHAFAED